MKKLTREKIKSLITNEIKILFNTDMLCEYYDQPHYQQKVEIQQVLSDDIWFYDHRPDRQLATQLPIELIRVNIVNPSAAEKMNLPGTTFGIIGLSFPHGLMKQPHETVFFLDDKEMKELATLLDQNATIAIRSNNSPSKKPMETPMEQWSQAQQIETLGGIRTYQESPMGGRTGAVPVFLDKEKPTKVKVGTARVLDPKSNKPMALVLVGVSTQVSYHTAKSFHSPIGGGYDVGWGKEHEERDGDSSFVFLTPLGAKKLAQLLRGHTKELGLAKNKIPAAIPLASPVDDDRPLPAIPVDDDRPLPAIPVHDSSVPGNRLDSVEEASSEKQRKWACAQAGSARKRFKGKPSLTKKQAAEFCADTKLSGKKKKKKKKK